MRPGESYGLDVENQFSPIRTRVEQHFHTDLVSPKVIPKGLGLCLVHLPRVLNMSDPDISLYGQLLLFTTNPVRDIELCHQGTEKLDLKLSA